jgi:hypothetical protein
VDRPKIDLPNANYVLINTRATKKNQILQKKKTQIVDYPKINFQNSNVMCSYQHTTQFESKNKNTRAPVDSRMHAICTETVKHNGFSIFFIEVLDELELFIDKKVIFDEIFFPSVRRPPSVSKFCNPHNFFSFQPRHFSFSG